MTLGQSAAETSFPAKNARAPAFAEHPLCGHSGARVVLHSGNRDAFVRKTAANEAANARLKAQADKQHALWMLGLPFPKVRSQHIGADGIASFDMNYIPGMTVAHAVANGGNFEPATIVKAVERLMRLFTLTHEGVLSPRLFQDKIQEVANRAAPSLGDAALDADVSGCARLLMDRDWGAIPKTACHGDLTLENILLTAGMSVAFIDCDEAFASSFWMDFGKLFQDFEGHWCIRALYRAQNSLPLLNAVQKLEQLGTRFRDLAARLDPCLPPRLTQLAALGLFRAIPYTRSVETAAFICRRIRRLMET